MPREEGAATQRLHGLWGGRGAIFFYARMELGGVGSRMAVAQRFPWPEGVGGERGAGGGEGIKRRIGWGIVGV